MGMMGTWVGIAKRNILPAPLLDAYRDVAVSHQFPTGNKAGNHSHQKVWYGNI